MYFRYQEKNSISVPTPFKRTITPLFMGDDDMIKESSFSVHVTEWMPGCQVDLHSHELSMEAMYCMAGNGIAEIDEVSYPFVTDSMIVAPPGVSHKITNTGDELLRVLCIFSPPITSQALRERALEAIRRDT